MSKDHREGSELGHGIEPAQKSYADTDNLPLDKLAEIGAFNNYTTAFRAKMDSITNPDWPTDEQLERAARENILLLDSLRTAANHYIFLELFERLHTAVLATSNRQADYTMRDQAHRVWGAPETLKAHRKNLHVVLALPDLNSSEQQSYSRLPVWVVGKEKVSPTAPDDSATASTKYLAVALEGHLPKAVRNYTEYNSATGRQRHRASAEGFLQLAREHTLSAHNTDDTDEYSPPSAMWTTVATVVNQNTYGLIEFTGPAHLRELRVTEEDISALKKHKKDRYDIRPSALAMLADSNSETIVHNVRTAQVDDFSMISFDTLGHLASIAEDYGLSSQLVDIVGYSKEARIQADELAARGLKRFDLPYSKSPAEFNIPKHWEQHTP